MNESRVRDNPGRFFDCGGAAVPSLSAMERQIAVYWDFENIHAAVYENSGEVVKPYRETFFLPSWKWGKRSVRWRVHVKSKS